MTESALVCVLRKTIFVSRYAEELFRRNRRTSSSSVQTVQQLSMNSPGVVLRGSTPLVFGQKSLNTPMYFKKHDVHNVLRGCKDHEAVQNQYKLIKITPLHFDDTESLQNNTERLKRCRLAIDSKIDAGSLTKGV